MRHVNDSQPQLLQMLYLRRDVGLQLRARYKQRVFREVKTKESFRGTVGVGAAGAGPPLLFCVHHTPKLTPQAPLTSATTALRHSPAGSRPPAERATEKYRASRSRGADRPNLRSLLPGPAAPPPPRPSASRRGGGLDRSARARRVLGHKSGNNFAPAAARRPGAVALHTISARRLLKVRHFHSRFPREGSAPVPRREQPSPTAAPAARLRVDNDKFRLRRC